MNKQPLLDGLQILFLKLSNNSETMVQQHQWAP